MSGVQAQIDGQSEAVVRAAPGGIKPQLTRVKEPRVGCFPMLYYIVLYYIILCYVILYSEGQEQGLKLFPDSLKGSGASRDGL